MSPEEHDAPEKEDEKSWTGVGDGAPRQQDVEESSATEVEQEDYKVFEGKKRTPPWRLSLYVGVIGLVLMGAIFVFPEFRRFSTPWDPSYPTAHILLLFPILAVIWAAVGFVGAAFREDRSRVWGGLVVAVVTFVLGYAVIVTDPARGAQEGITGTDERLDMTEEELREWRVEKLNR